jgi:hypothetical protein
VVWWSGTGSNRRPSAFQGERRPTSGPLAEVSVADAHPPRFSIVSAESAVSRPSRARSIRETWHGGHGLRDGSYQGGRGRVRAPPSAHAGPWVRRAINGPLTPVKRGLSRSLADSLPCRSGHVTGPDGIASQADSPAWRNGAGGRNYAGGKVGGLPRTRRGSIHASRNLSRAPAASLRDRLRRPWTEPVCRQVRQQSGSGEGSGQAAVRSVPQCRPGSSDDDRGAARLGV